MASAQPDDLSGLPDLVRNQLERRMAVVATLQTPEERKRALADASRKVRLLRVQERIAEKTAEIAEAERLGGSPEDMEPLQLVLKDLYAEQQRLKARGSASEPRSTR
ncbi:MAG: hypothetical protein ACK4N5_02240 [Myxococcales bacterium]